MTSSLVVDLHGPIAFLFSKQWAWAYIPNCNYHRCNVLTDTDDKSPARNNTFLLSGPTGAGTAQLKNPNKVILVPWNVVKIPAPDAKQCYCIFQMPLPDFIYGLRSDYVDLIAPDQEWKGLYARGLRFYYNACPIQPTIAPTPSVSPDPTDPNDLTTLDPTCLRPDSNADVAYRIEVRYRSVNPVEDDYNPHADAYMCSASMRVLFCPLDNWKVNFERQSTASTKDPLEYFKAGGGPRPVDCGANQLVFSDGGLTF